MTMRIAATMVRASGRSTRRLPPSGPCVREATHRVRLLRSAADRRSIMWHGRVAAALILLVLTGCSSGTPGTAATDGTGSFGYPDCAEAMGPLLRKLEAIDARLDVGMVQADYGNAVGGAAVVYKQVDVGALANDCLRHVAMPLEDAYNHYVRANTRWNNCIVGDYCDVNRDALPEMRRHWSAASRLIKQAEDALDETG